MSAFTRVSTRYGRNAGPPGRAARAPDYAVARWRRATAPSGLRIKPRLAPRRALRVTREFDPVMQPERPVLPELDLERLQPVAGPIRRSWNRSNREFRRREGDRLLE